MVPYDTGSCVKFNPALLGLLSAMKCGSRFRLKITDVK
jgi:hypothetical protein